MIDTNIEIITHYLKRLDIDEKNISRVKKFYNDDESFNILMKRIVDKDNKRVDILLNGNHNIPNTWRILYIILEIVLEEGINFPPVNNIMGKCQNITMLYKGWIFSWNHGLKNTIISIYDTHNVLIYRF